MCVNVHILQVVFQRVVQVSLQELYFKFMTLTQMSIFLHIAYSILGCALSNESSICTALYPLLQSVFKGPIRHTSHL